MYFFIEKSEFFLKSPKRFSEIDSKGEFFLKFEEFFIGMNIPH